MLLNCLRIIFYRKGKILYRNIFSHIPCTINVLLHLYNMTYIKQQARTNTIIPEVRTLHENYNLMSVCTDMYQYGRSGK